MRKTLTKLLLLTFIGMMSGVYAWADNVAKIGSTEYATLQEAVDDAYANMTGDVTITLLSDITANTVVRQKSGLNQTIDGSNKTITGQILIDGKGFYGDDVLVIKNINFTGNTTNFVSGKDAFVGVPNPSTLPSPYTASRLSDGHNITIDNCTFTSNSAEGSYTEVGIKAESGANVKGLTITNCTGSNLHSFAQLTGTTDATFDNCTANSSGSFIGVNGGGGTYSISNCTFPSSKEGGYAIRVKSGNTADITLTNNELTATDAIILSSAANLTVESGSYTGNITKSAGTLAITGGTFDTDVTAYLADGYSLINNNGVYTVFEGTVVAKIDDTYYSSLAEAVTAAPAGATITLIADDNSLTDGSEITINKSLTITGAVDAQGNPLYTIYGKSDATGTNDIFITGSGTVSLSNLKVKNFGNNAATDIGHAPIYVSTNFTGTVNLTNVYVSDFNRGGIFLYGGSFNVEDCYIDCANARSGAFTKGIEIKGSANGTIRNTLIGNMERGNVTDAPAGIEIYGNGSILVEGCTILSNIDNNHQTTKGTYGIVSQRVGAHDPSGGSLQVRETMISSTNACLSVADNDAYGPVNNYSITVDECDFDNYIATWSAGSSITINSGSYAEDVYADAGTIIIHGGEYTNFAPDTGTNGSIIIDGGTFDEPVPEKYCAEGYIPTVLGDGFYGVKEGAYVAQIGDVKYETLQAAVDAATAGATINILKDFTLTTVTSTPNNKYNVNINKNLTINGNGHTITSSTGKRALALTGEGNNITLKGLTVVNDNADWVMGILNNLTCTLDNTTIDGSGYSGSWNQPLTIGGISETGRVTLNVTNGSVIKTNNEGTAHYAIIAWHPADITVTNSSLIGWANVYIKPDAEGSTVNISNSTLTSQGVAGSSNNFAMFTTECGNNTIVLTDNNITINAASNTYETIVSLNGTGNTVKILGDQTTFTTNDATYGGITFNWSSLAGDANALKFDANTKELFAAYVDGVSQVISETPDENGLYSLTFAPEVLYYWATESGNEGVYCSFAEPFVEGWLDDGEFIALQKNVTLTENIACQLTEGQSFNFLLGDYTVTKGNYSVSLETGVSVITDKQTDIFTAADADYKVVGTATENGYTYTVVEKTYVAQIGDVKYETLAEAIAAVSTDGTETTITMIADEAIVAGVTIAAGQNIVLELNGKTISGNTDSSKTYALITNKGTLTIQDNTDTNKDGTGTGLVTTYISNPDGGDVPGYASNTITNNGTLTVKSGKIVNNGSGYACYAIDSQTNGNLYTPVLNIEGGRMQQMNAYTYAVRMFCNSQTNTNTVNVSGGVIEGGYGLWLQTPNNKANMASLNITGGTINANDGAALYIGGTKADNSKIAIDISGGNINGTGVIIQGPLSGTYGSVSISDGNIVNVQCGANVEHFISGGIYDNPVNEAYCAEGYIPTDLGNDKYSVKPGSFVAKIGDVKYETLEAAFAAAQDGETITLLANCEGNGIVAPQGKFTNGITVDFGGFTYSVTGNLVGSSGTETQAFQLLKDNKITFTNGTIYSEKALFLVQNYSDLTLQNMTLTLDNANYAYGYTLSNNNGNVVIDGSTINANPAGAFAFDVCRYSSYPSVSVTVTGASVINGDIEISASGNDAKEGFALALNGGTLNGSIVLDASAAAAMAANPEKAIITKSDGFTAAAPEGYKWEDIGDNTSILVALPMVAQIGDTQYYSLAAAIAAVPAGTQTTITMIADEIISVSGYALTVAANQNVVLDLNGHQVVGTCETEGTSALIRNLGTLTIKDSSAEGTGKLIAGASSTWTWDGTDNYAGSYASNLIRNEKNLIVESGHLYNMSTGSAAYAIDNYSAGNVTINGGTVDAAKASAIRMFYVNGGSVTVNGGAVGHYNSDDDYSFMGIQVMGGSNVNVSVTGGTIAGQYAMYANNTGGNIAISGGTFDGYVGFAASVPNISITDGTFNEWAGTWGTQTGFISGGEFIEKVDAAYCAEGYICSEEPNENGYYIIKLGSYVALVGDYGYETFLAAAADAEGEVITLLADVADAYSLTEDETLKVALNGHTLTVNSAIGGYEVNSSLADGVTTYTLVQLDMSNEDVVIIDNQLYNYINDTQVKSATYVRTFTYYQYMSWFVPFEYTITEDDLENFVFYKINMIANSPEAGESEESNSIWIFINKMTAGQKLKANYPYVIKPKNGVTEYRFVTEGATLRARNDNALAKTETMDNIYTFYGTNEPVTLNPDDPELGYYLNTKGSLSRPRNSHLTIKPNRWILRVGSKDGGLARPVSFRFAEDSETTDLHNIVVGEEGDTYYTLDGLKVQTPGKGVYIKRSADGKTKKVTFK